ncbi:MAG: hypothetical protein LQ342_006186 [Letrouitia transgressa]|nr:MAG: hypothetical protein LQ342_006186 [Letrouitia transgressa]
MIFENKRPQVSPSVDQQDLSIALNGGVRTLTLEAILTNNAYVLPEQGDLYSTFNLTRNNAAVRFEGFPCNGSELEPNLPPIPITPPRFSDVAVAFSGILDLLLVRAARTKANVGVGGAALVTNLDHVAVTDRAVKVGNWTYFGIFNIQPAQEPYTPQTRVAGIRYHCEGVVEQQDVASS